MSATGAMNKLSLHRPLFFFIFMGIKVCKVKSACNILTQSINIKYLTLSQQQLYNITDPCVTTCTTGFYGDFCQDLSMYSKLPMGPWNQAGYCTNGGGVMRSMSIDVSNIFSIQYTRKDSILIGISYGGYSNSIISEISLYSRAVTPVMYPTPAGSLDSLVVRKGVIYVARSIKVNGAVRYDIAVLNAPLKAQTLMPISTNGILIEVCNDKGKVTAFVYGSNQVNACYPNGICNTWVSYTPSITGMISGADGGNTLYASSGSDILKLTSTGTSILKSTTTPIYCLTGIPDINVLLYKSRNNMWQINIDTNTILSLPLGTTQTQEVVCSADVSEQNNQILIVQRGTISTLEAVQESCPFGKTSQAILCNSTTQCTMCPPPPSNALPTEGSVICEWYCMSGYVKIGSRCIAQVVQPCPNYYKISPDSPGLCIPSVLPWTDQGKYVTSRKFSSQMYLTIRSPPYLLTVTSDGSSLIQAVQGRFSVSRDNGMSWANVAVVPFASTRCYSSAQNSYYYLSSRSNIIWTAFTIQHVEGTQHCLWAVDATNVTFPQGGQQLKVIQAWALNTQLCSATGEGEGVYAVLCGHHYISYAKLQSGSVLLPVIGSPIAGYIDGTFLAAKFSNPSSVVACDSRLYISDTGNCLIREVDPLRGVVGTIAGVFGTCQRADGIGSGTNLVYPTNLIYTPYNGFFLFVDKYTNENFAVIRQFHAHTSTVNTVSIMPYSYFTGIIASDSAIIVSAQHIYYIYNASWEYCPAGTSSIEGTAFDSSSCLTCPVFHYSDTVSGSCLPCSSPSCGLPGQLLIPCQLSSDAHCGSCTNKPTNNSKYIGASRIPGTTDGGGDCTWAYTPPCPVGYYSLNTSGGVCSSCPIWSTTAKVGSGSISNCTCMADGKWSYLQGSNGVTESTESIMSCLIKSPFSSFPARCGPLEACKGYMEPAFPFPILPSCTSFDTDTYVGVCPCQPGEYIHQIYPKVCSNCPAGLYSPDGRDCRTCPYLTEPSSDRSTCRCAAGTYDVALTQAAPRCLCGPGKAFHPSHGCVQCSENTYSTEIRDFSATRFIDSMPTVSSMLCIQCPEGMWSPTGASECIQCPLGKFRQQVDTACQSCPVGSYAPIPTEPQCVNCLPECQGKMETKCPTDDNLLMCSDCRPPRANSAFNGQRDCATSCKAGFYELDNECVECTVYYKATCPEGNRLVDCTSYADSGCIACTNTSMPLNYAVWSYTSNSPDGPSLLCEWECEAGYAPRRTPLPVGVDAAWECFKAGEWSVWDLFTL
jgi:hypothetical protein